MVMMLNQMTHQFAVTVDARNVWFPSAAPRTQPGFRSQTPPLIDIESLRSKSLCDSLGRRMPDAIKVFGRPVSNKIYNLRL